MEYRAQYLLKSCNQNIDNENYIKQNNEELGNFIFHCLKGKDKAVQTIKVTPSQKDRGYTIVIEYEQGAY